ncbi:hypothetical protein BJX64DRAFT_246844 [Aspergillus heterothallicus]
MDFGDYTPPTNDSESLSNWYPAPLDIPVDDLVEPEATGATVPRDYPPWSCIPDSREPAQARLRSVMQKIDPRTVLTVEPTPSSVFGYQPGYGLGDVPHAGPSFHHGTKPFSTIDEVPDNGYIGSSKVRNSDSVKKFAGPSDAVETTIETDMSTENPVMGPTAWLDQWRFGESHFSPADDPMNVDETDGSGAAGFQYADTTNNDKELSGITRSAVNKGGTVDRIYPKANDEPDMGSNNQLRELIHPSWEVSWSSEFNTAGIQEPRPVGGSGPSQVCPGDASIWVPEGDQGDEEITVVPASETNQRVEHNIQSYVRYQQPSNEEFYICCCCDDGPKLLIYQPTCCACAHDVCTQCVRAFFSSAH